MHKGEILIYQSEDQSTQIEVRVADETIWLSQKQIAVLFGCSIDNVAWHLKNIYKEEELKEGATSEDSSEVHQEGNRWSNCVPCGCFPEGSREKMVCLFKDQD